MARYFSRIQGNRGEATRLGSASSGIQAQAQGWNLGATVNGGPDEFDSEDSFTVWITGGSNGGRYPVELATFASCRDGSVRIRLGDRFGGGLYDLSTGLIETNSGGYIVN